MLRPVTVAIPGALATLTGGYGYARRLLDGLPAAGWVPTLLSLPDGFPFPSDAALAASAAALRQAPADRPLLIDGLAFAVLPPDLLRAIAAPLIALVHHPLALETGLDAATAARLAIGERAALGVARAVVVTSGQTGRDLVAGYDVPAEAVTLALPGTDPAPRAIGTGRPARLLSVATVTPRKGPAVLAAALARLKDLSWRTHWVGSLDRSPRTVADLRAAVAGAGLADRVILTGPLGDDALAAEWAAADVFVLPSFHEGYGMAFAEALARGLPVVAAAAGAVPDLVPAAAGALVPPGDDRALAEVLRVLIADPGHRRRCADAAWRAGQALPRWPQTVAAVAGALARVMAVVRQGAI